MKQNIEFYPHYATSDQHAKFKMLRVQFGWEGEGKFWALNNRIALAAGCRLDISKKYNRAALASDLNFTLDEFAEFVTFLKNDCELIKECEDGTITTDIIQETFARVMQDRGKARERHRRTSGEKIETSGEKIHIVKERKGKDSKVKDKKGEFLSDSVEYKLANYLFKFILRRNPNHKKPNLQKWAKHISRMIRVDKRDPEKIKQVIEWCQEDTPDKQRNGDWKGWASNILSTKKLRDQYDTLFIKMEESMAVVTYKQPNLQPQTCAQSKYEEQRSLAKLQKRINKSLEERE